MSAHPDIFAGILVGGAGRRLGGRDKAGLRLPSGATLLQRLLESVAPHVHQVVLAARPGQRVAGAAPCVYDHFADCGPLGGLEALLRQPPAPWCWLLAVDMPQVGGAYLDVLADARRPGVQAVVPYSRDRAEPCAALYHASLHGQVHARLSGKERALKALLAAVPHAIVAAPDGLLKNINWPGDMAELSCT